MEINIPLNEQELQVISPYVQSAMLLALAEGTLDARTLNERSKARAIDLAVAANIEIPPDDAAINLAFHKLKKDQLISWTISKGQDSVVFLTEAGKQQAEELGQARV